jgi:hypothetical protein
MSKKFWEERLLKLGVSKKDLDEKKSEDALDHVDYDVDAYGIAGIDREGW